MKKEAITMPVLSDTMEVGHLAGWLKKPGDPVKKGDALAEVESDKAIMDIEAFSDGYLSGPLAEAGSDILVGGIIGYITDTAEIGAEETSAKSVTISSEKAAQEMPHTATVESTTETTKPPHSSMGKANASHGGRVKISPYARGLAQELGIDLATTNPDPHGFIHSPQVVAAALQGTSPDLDAGPEWHYKLLSPMRRAIATNMAATLNTPTFHISADLPFDPLHQAARTHGLSPTLLLARALALTTGKHSDFNSVFTPRGLAVRKQVNVGIAADTPRGLVTPVLADAARRPIMELAEDWRILKDKLTRQRLTPDDYKGATIYLSNLGVFNVVKSFAAIIPLGAAAILSVGAEKQGIASFVLSCDHRVVYGADAAHFMQTFEQLISNPEGWLVIV